MLPDICSGIKDCSESYRDMKKGIRYARNTHWPSDSFLCRDGLAESRRRLHGGGFAIRGYDPVAHLPPASSAVKDMPQSTTNGWAPDGFSQRGESRPVSSRTRNATATVWRRICLAVSQGHTRRSTRKAWGRSSMAKLYLNYSKSGAERSGTGRRRDISKRQRDPTGPLHKVSSVRAWYRGGIVHDFPTVLRFGQFRSQELPAPASVRHHSPEGKSSTYPRFLVRKLLDVEQHEDFGEMARQFPERRDHP